MNRQCFITNKKTKVGRNVSHANNKTRRLFRVNMKSIKIRSNNKTFKIRVSAKGIKTITKLGLLKNILQKQ